MKKYDKFELMKDLARLLDKYGHDVFLDLSNFLKSKEAIDNLASILEVSAHVSKNSARRKAITQQDSVQNELNIILENVRKRDESKARSILNFIQIYNNKSAFPTIRSVRDFAVDNGLAEIKVSSKRRAIIPIVNDLISRQTNEIEEIISSIRVRDIEVDRTLEGWTNVIFDKRNRDR